MVQALAWRNARAVLGNLPRADLMVLGDRRQDKAAAHANPFGFARATDDLRALMAAPAVAAVPTPRRNRRMMAWRWRQASMSGAKSRYADPRPTR